MEKLVPILFFLVCAIRCAGCIITDKEYAHLPPVFELDNFDRCLLLEDEALYCYMEFKVQPLNYSNTSLTWQRIEEVSKNHRNYRHDILRHGICVPFTCPSIKLSHEDPKFKEALAECYSKKYENMGLYGTIGEMNCQTNKPREFDLLDKAALIFFIAYALFVIYASFYEGSARYKSPEEYRIATTGTTTGKILTCFSIPYNWNRLARMSNDAETEALKPMQGIRVYNFFLVTFCHTVMGAVCLPISNLRWAETIPDNFGSVFIVSAPFVVQTNFLMASWLLTYHILKNFDNKSGRKLNLKAVLVIAINRYIRLVTPFAVILLFQCTLLYHLGRSPIWDLLVGREKEFCRENGWTNLLFVNNMINADRMCFVETWYTAVDMHGFLLVLLILYFTVKNPQRLLWIVPSIWVLTKVIQVKLLSDYDIYTFFEPDPELLYLLKVIYDVNGVWHFTWTNDLTHTGGILMGVLAGYLFYKNRNRQIFTKKIHVVLWWVCSFGPCLSVIIFPGLWMFSESYFPSKLFSWSYYTLSPAIFAMGITLGIFGLSQNIGWFACSVVRWNPVYFLGKLAYSAFLVHMPYTLYRKGFTRSLEYLNETNIVIELIEIFTMSFMLGLILCLTVEFPTSALQSLLLKNKNENIGPEIKKSDEIKTSDEKKQKKL